MKTLYLPGIKKIVLNDGLLARVETAVQEVGRLAADGSRPRIEFGVPDTDLVIRVATNTKEDGWHSVIENDKLPHGAVFAGLGAYRNGANESWWESEIDDLDVRRIIEPYFSDVFISQTYMAPNGEKNLSAVEKEHLKQFMQLVKRDVRGTMKKSAVWEKPYYRGVVSSANAFLNNGRNLRDFRNTLKKKPEEWYNSDGC